MEELVNNISNIWKDISEEKLTKGEVYSLLDKYSDELKKYREEYPAEIILDISDMISSLYKLLTKSINDENLKITSITLKYTDEVYYIFYKSQIKEFMLELDWFFPLYQKAEIVAENNSFIQLKDKQISTLAFITNIIMDKDKKVIFCRDLIFLKDFYESFK